MNNEAAIRILLNSNEYHHAKGDLPHSAASIEAFNKAIDALKAERPKGEWKRITNESANIQMFLCSVCGRKVEVGYSHIPPSEYYPFCHCGADMRGGAE